MPKVITMPHGAWGNDSADWQGTPEEFRAKMAEAEGQQATPSEPAPAARHKFLNLRDLAVNRAKPPEFLITPLVPRGFVTLLGGHGEVGKSQLGLIMAMHVASGKDWGGLSVAKGRVLYISLEDDASVISYRLGIISEEYRLSWDDLAAGLDIIDASDEGPLAQEVYQDGIRHLQATALSQEYAALAKGYDLVIVDNASDGFDADENSRRQVRFFIKGLAAWIKQHNGAVLLLVHVDKAAARNGAQGNSYSGSTAWHNSARSRLAMAATKEGGTELVHEKCNVAKKLEEPLILQWSERGVLVHVSAIARESAKVLADSAYDQDVYHAIRAAMEFGKVIPTATTGPSTCWHALCAFPELPTALKNKAGKPKLEATLIRLQRQGLIRPEKYRQDYKDRERWVLC